MARATTQEIGNNVRRRRAALGWSQAGLARMVNGVLDGSRKWSGVNVSRVENGVGALYAHELTAFAVALQCDPAELLVGAGEEMTARNDVFAAVLDENERLRVALKTARDAINVSLLAVGVPVSGGAKI